VRKKRESKPKRYLDLLLKDEIVEGRADSSLLSRRTKTSLQHLLQVVERASRDRRIAGLLVTIENLHAGWSRLSSLRRAIIQFRSSGKPAYCFIEHGGNQEYYLACACDRIFMSQASSLHLVGLSSEIFFLRDILQRFGVEAQLYAVGEYKSAGEMFTRSNMSEPARQQWNELLDDYYEELCGAIAESRRMEKAQVVSILDSGPYTVREAVQQHLLDGMCYRDEVESKLSEALGGPVVSVSKYGQRDGWLRRLFTPRRPQIAVIELVGAISEGESRRDRVGRQVLGAETIGKFLDHARESRKIRAVVLRIDSPGGTGLASDSIWRKVLLIRRVKPVVVSFGDVAASGGYYVAASASRIFAEPTSITGSIGVLGGKFIGKELLQQLQIRRESIQRGAHADYDSPFESFSRSELERLNSQLEEFYRQDFVKKVAEGRNQSEEAIDKAGRGRVWSGRRAMKLGLIDRLGGLTEAVREARQLAHIGEKAAVRLVHYYKRRKLRDMLLPELGVQTRSGTENAAADLLAFFEQLQSCRILLLLPYQIRIR
jgi:protease-4